MEWISVLYLHPNTYAFELLILLAVAGEFPRISLGLLGNERILKRVIHNGKSVQEVSILTGEKFSVQLFTEVGQGKLRSIKIHRSCIEVLERLCPKITEYYISSYRNKFMPAKLIRNHRIAEGIAMFCRAGVEYKPCALPPLITTGKSINIKQPSFYLSRTLKNLYGEGMSKTKYTRIIGALFCPDAAYAVYNTRNADMKWVGSGEYKAHELIEEIAKNNCGIEIVDSAIVLASSFEKALNTMVQERKGRQEITQRLDSIFFNILYIPLDKNGIKMLRIISQPNWHKRVINAMFNRSMQQNKPKSMECDAFYEGIIILTHFDGNISRLARFKESASNKDAIGNLYEVICYDFQANAIEEYLESLAVVRPIAISKIEELFGGTE